MSTKVITVNRECLIDNVRAKEIAKIHGAGVARHYGYIAKGPIEIQIFAPGEPTVVRKAAAAEINGRVSVKYDPSAFIPPMGCGPAVITPKAVWMEIEGEVTYTDMDGDIHVIG